MLWAMGAAPSSRDVSGQAPRTAGAASDADHGLVEREVYLAQMQAAIRLAASGEGSLVFVQGPAGIGKTVLLAACGQRALSSGLELRAARCSELERDFTHGVVRQLFERRIVEAVADARERLLAGPAANAAEVILSADPAQRHVIPGDSDFAAMHGLYWLAANIAAEGPLLLVIDDAQWADAASLRFVNYLSSRLSGLPLLMVLAARSDDPGAGAELLQTLARNAACALRLAALSAAGSAQIVRQSMGATGSFAAACHDSSGGNPFLLHELLSAVAADGVAGDDGGASRVRQLGPQSVSRSVFLRLARLPSGAAEFARAVAVLGDHVELSDAAALAGISLERASSLSDALAVAGVLAPELPLCFIHPVILEAIVGDLGPGERTAMHARAAELLHTRGAGADQVAAHLSATGPFGQPWAVDVLRQAARAASARGAPDVAQRHLHRALREEQTAATRGVVLAELGEAQWQSGDDPAAAITCLREACRLTVDPAVRVQATIALARAISSTGDVAAAADALLRALEGPDDFGPAGRVCLEAELGSVGLLNLSLMPHVRERLTASREPVGTSTEELLMLCNLAVLKWMFGDATETVALARRALSEGRLLASVGSDSIAFLQAVWVLSGSDEADEALAACDAALTEARERGSAFGFVTHCAVSALIAIRAGDVREGEAHARTGIALPDIPLFVRPGIYAHLALALIERGELDEAEATLEEGFIGPHLPVLAHWNLGFYARGLLRVAQRRDEEALAELMEFGRREKLCCVSNPSVRWRIDAGRVCLRLGRTSEAEALIGEHEATAASWGAPGPQGIGLQGRAAATEGPERIALLERAHELLARSPRRLDQARVLLDLGSALRRAGRRRDAQRRLGEAVVLAHRCGATALATRANDELGVLSTRPRRLQFSGVEALTASERRIALMAADGQSNPQIAQSLFVTAKTVENHLGRVYIKLAINSRSQLPTALGETDPGAPMRNPHAAI